jgi:hypothetical protein
LSSLSLSPPLNVKPPKPDEGGLALALLSRLEEVEQERKVRRG